jgi:hypothetical protein
MRGLIVFREVRQPLLGRKDAFGALGTVFRLFCSDAEVAGQHEQYDRDDPGKFRHIH